MQTRMAGTSPAMTQSVGGEGGRQPPEPHHETLTGRFKIGG